MSTSAAVVPLLPARDRRRISIRLAAGLAGVALLGLGSALTRLQPDQWQLGEALRALAALVVGAPLLASGIRGVITGDPRRATDQLVAIAVLAAASDHDFTTATLVPLVLEIGRLFEDRTSLGARAAIAGIQALAARRATRWTHGVEERVDPADLHAGEVLLVRPGERIAVDGTVVQGTSAIDQSPITGESTPEDVGPGSPVFAGAVNLTGLLQVTVREVGSQTVLGRVVATLTELEQARLPVVRGMERRAAAWLPLVLTIAGTTLFFTHDLRRAIAALVVLCPTALVVAGPAAVVAAMTAATRKRMLIKNAAFLERLSEIDTLLIDKTGTATLGTPEVTGVAPVSGISADTLLTVAATCAFGSLHPVSRAIVAEARARRLDVPPPDQVDERPGLGVIAKSGKHELRLGRRSFVDPGNEQDEKVWVARDGAILGAIVHRDRPRPEARVVVDAMRDLGIDRVVLLTGDRAEIARVIGDELGVDEVVAGELPQGKLDVVRREQAADRTVLMVGDGVNDALALSAADVGVAVGAEINEVALGGADVALLGADLSRLPDLVRLADRTHAIATGNIAIALVVAIGLLPFAVMGVIDPVLGAFLGNLGTVAVVANSVRLLGSTRTEPVRHSVAPNAPLRDRR